MSVDPVAKTMSEASESGEVSPPKSGDQFRCSNCGMTIQVTTGCHCKDKRKEDYAHFHCCGNPLTKV